MLCGLGAARSIIVSPRGALLFCAKLFTLLFNKWAARASDGTEDEDTMEHSRNPLAMFAEEDSLEDNETAANDIDDSGEFENPVADESPRGSKQLAFNKDLVKNPAADESQESHSPSPSFCLCNTMALGCWLATGLRRSSGMPWYLNCLAYAKSFSNESSTGSSAARIAYGFTSS